MKQVVSNYSYSPATNVVTLTGVNIDQDQLLLVVAPQVGRTMYNFASGVTGAVSAGADTRITLNASTVGLTTTSPLVIFYDDHVPATSVTGTVALDPASLIALENITVTVGSSVALAAGSAQIGSVTVANFPATQTIAGTVTANATLAQDVIEYFDESGASYAVAVHIKDAGNNIIGSGGVIPISGTVTANSVFPNNFINQTGTDVNIVAYAAAVGWNEADANFPIIGNANPLPVQIVQSAYATSITANNPSGALTTRFGSVTTANTAQITSAVTNASRKFLLVQNIATSTVTIGIGFSPTTTQGIQLASGAGLTFDAFCPTGAVYWLSGVTGTNWSVLEG